MRAGALGHAQGTRAGAVETTVSQRDDHRAESNRARERPLSVMVEWCGGQMPTLMGFAAWAREAALRSLRAPAPTRGGERRQAGGRRRGATRTGETEEGDAQPWRGEGPTRGCRAGGDKSSEPRLNLSGSWQQGHSAAYNTPFLIQVVCK